MLDAQKPFRIVSMVDPALSGVPRAVMEEYATRRDISVIEPFFDKGKMPTIYHARRIPRSVWTRFVMSQATDDLKAQMCFQFGVIKVEGVFTDDGVRIAFDPTGSVQTGDGNLAHLKDEEMDRFYPDEISEIGGVIFSRSFFRPSIDVIYVPPLMCREQWARLAVFSADANQTTPAKNSEKRSEPATQPSGMTGQDRENDEKK